MSKQKRRNEERVWDWRKPDSLSYFGLLSLRCLLFNVLLFFQTDAVAQTMDEKLRSDPLMVPHYTGSILPTPQKVDYKDVFIPLSKACIVVGNDVENAQPLVDFLKERIVRYGGQVVTGSAPDTETSVIIVIGKTAYDKKISGLPTVPEKEQGYIVHYDCSSKTPIVVLKGHDRLGLLWAISSFNQLVHWKDNHAMARAATVVDYPKLLNRGYITVNLNAEHIRNFVDPMPDPSTGRRPAPFSVDQERIFSTLCKFNMPVYRSLSFQNAKWGTSWRDTGNQDQERRDTIEKLKQLVTPLGIEWYGGFSPIRVNPGQKAGGDEESINSLLYYARQVEDAGGHFTLMLDDVRFPINPYDKEHFGSGRETDTYVVTTLLKKLQVDYPDAELMVCPPFYWGPVGRSHQKEYGEPREPYLRLIGEKWPDKVHVSWTGPRVDSNLASKEHVEWITDLIKRKPYFYQNDGFLRGVYNYHYGAEAVTNLPARYWDGFFESIGCFGPNSQMPRKAIVTLALSDFMWNPDAHDPEKVMKEAVSKLVGPDSWETMRKLTTTLQYFEQYYLPRLNTPPGAVAMKKAARQIDQVTNNLAIAQACIEKLYKDHFAGITYWTDCDRYVSRQGMVVKDILTDRDLKPYRDAAFQEQAAARDGLFDPQTETFLAVSDFNGGLIFEVKDPLTGSKASAHVLDDVLQRCSAQFIVPDGTQDALELVLCLKKGSTPCAISALLNGKKLTFNVDSLDEFNWETVTMKLPGSALKAAPEKNVIEIVTKKEESSDTSEDDSDVSSLLGESSSSTSDSRLAIRYGIVRAKSHK